MDLIKIVEEAFATPKKQFDEFGPGDTVTVSYRIKEGNKERIQQYRGVVIRINGSEDKKRFTVRKVSDGIGVERIFPIESPFIESITVNKYGRCVVRSFIISATSPARKPASKSVLSRRPNKKAFSFKKTESACRSHSVLGMGTTFSGSNYSPIQD